MRVTALPTPQVLVDLRRLQANLDRMQAMATAHGLRLRPHAKTHKCPAIARWQIARGAVGLCCAKVGEAEVFADAGFEDLRLAYPIHPSNAARLLALLERVRLSLIVDHPAVAEGWSAVLTRAGRVLDVLVKVDVGFHRCGIDPDPPRALSFLRQVAALPGLRLRGLLSHAGHAYHARSEAELAAIAAQEAQLLARVAEAARREGLPIEEVSVGATPTARFSVAHTGLTELRPGNYVFFDRSQVALGAAQPTDCALTVLATVVSKPASDRIVLDCGSKTLSADGARGFAPPPGYGTLYPDPEAPVADETLVVDRLSEEHAVVRATTGTSPLEPGDRVRVLPNHACVVVNLVDTLCLVDGLELVDHLPVAARGKIQ